MTEPLQQRPSMKKHTILFLAANPSGTDGLALDREARAIQAELDSSGYRDCFEFVTRWAVEPLDLLRELRRLRPTVVHFSGHGGGCGVGAEEALSPLHRCEVAADRDSLDTCGLFFQHPDGTARIVSAAALDEAFGAAGSSVRLVLLNACYSEPQAEALSAHIDCVVGMAGSVHDDAARSFAIGFYGGLGERESVDAAYRQGCAAISLDGLPQGDRPRLKVRGGIDPKRLVIAPGPSLAPLSSLTRAGGNDGTERRSREPVQRRSTVRSTAGEPAFMGRAAEFAAIENKLHAGGIVVVHGPPGLGKSRLVKEYAHAHVDDYPGGRFFVPFGQPPPTELAKLLRDTARPAHADEPVEDQCRRALREIGNAGRALLIYDAIADESVLRDWLPYDGLDWHLIVTSTSARWGTAWSTVALEPLPPDAARALVASILGDATASDRLAEPIAARAAGVTIELCASAAAAHERLRRGRTVDRVSADLAKETASSFESAWTLLSSDAQLVLQVASTFVTPHVPGELVVAALQRIGWDAARVEDAIDDSRDRGLGGGRDELDVHQLVARFVQSQGPLEPAVRRILLDGMVGAAREYSKRPGDLDRRALLLAHSLDIQEWIAVAPADFEWHTIGHASAELGKYAEALPWCERAVAQAETGVAHGRVGHATLGSRLQQVGDCLSSLGEHARALPWFERALAAKQNGDAQGAIDPESLGRSLHQIGYCYASQGEYAEALPWFERAVAEAEKGDLLGRIDPASIGTSVHLVGYCYSRQRRYAEALPWFERAVVEAEKGDVHGRLDADRLGTSLHQVGYCYSSQGQYADALSWFERAVTATEKGDVHGRVDPAGHGRSLHEVGYCYFRLDRFADALLWFNRAVGAKEQGDLHGRVDPGSVGKSLHQVGYCYFRLGRFTDALPWFERAAAAKEQGDLRGQIDPVSLRTTIQQVIECCMRLGKLDDASAWGARASRAATSPGRTAAAARSSR